MSSSTEAAWLRLWLVLALLIGGAALWSPWAALLVAGVLFGAWGLLWIAVRVGFDAILWVLEATTKLLGAAFERATASERAELSGIHAEIAWHGTLMRARYPEQYADAEREMYQRRSRYFDQCPPFDYEGTLARYRQRQDELARSAAPFVEELGHINQLHRLFDAEELGKEERRIHELRRDLLAQRCDGGVTSKCSVA
jgi:hypothetical protein